MIRSLHDLVAELGVRSPQIAAMNLSATLPNFTLKNDLFNLANTPKHLDLVTRAIGLLVAESGVTITGAKRMAQDLLSDKFYGCFFELATYDWLHRHHVRFHAQPTMSGKDVLNPNGCTLDGHFDLVDAYFDIKAMGLQAHVAERFRKQLEDKLPNGLRITIDGSMDVDVQDIQRAFGKIDDLVQELTNGGIQQLPELGWTLRAQPPQAIIMSEQTTDPYRLAEENRFLPFKDAGQFARRAPFVLIFAYAARFNLALSVNFVGSTDTMLRALARRSLLQFANDASPVDSRKLPGVSLADASRLLSALLFVNVDNDDASLFSNPRATHPLTRYHVDQMFDFTLPLRMAMDDLAHDDY